jgi:hypothetical protein
MEGYRYNPATKDIVLLASCSDEVELRMIVGLLEANNIRVCIDRKDVGANTGGKSNIFGFYKVYVSSDNFSSAKEIIEDSIKTFQGGEHYKEESKKKDKLPLRILLLLNCILFGMLGYYTSLTSEKIMGAALAGASVFFLLVFFFSFNWQKKRHPN